jgi:hypothetical protein
VGSLEGGHVINYVGGLVTRTTCRTLNNTDGIVELERRESFQMRQASKYM